MDLVAKIVHTFNNRLQVNFPSMDNDYRLDEIDKRILYRLEEEARDTAASEIAEEVDVSPGTIRNRIKKLEEKGIIKGYHADVNYEKVGRRLTNFFKCSSSVKSRESIARKILKIPGIIKVKEMVTGRDDLHVKAIAEDIKDIARISRDLEELGIEIKNKDMIGEEYFHPYHYFAPKGGEKEPMVDFRRIGENAETADLTIVEGVPAARKTLKELNEENLIDKDILVISIEREEENLTPKGDTRIKPGDIVTILSPKGLSKKSLNPFTEKQKN